MERSASLNDGSEWNISFRSDDLKPTSAGEANWSNVFAMVSNALRSSDNSGGVH